MIIIFNTSTQNEKFFPYTGKVIKEITGIHGQTQYLVRIYADGDQGKLTGMCCVVEPKDIVKILDEETETESISKYIDIAETMMNVGLDIISEIKHRK